MPRAPSAATAMSPPASTPPRLPRSVTSKAARDPLALMDEAARLGDVAEARLGPFRFWLMANPEDAERILITDFKGFRKPDDRLQRQLRMVFGDNLVTTEGDAWTRHRRMIAPSFHKRHLESWAGIMARGGEDLAADWARGGPQDVLPRLIDLTFDVIQRTLVGSDPEARGRDLAEGVARIMADRRKRRALPLPLWVPTPAHRRLHRSVAQIDAAVAEATQRRRRAADPGDDILGLFLQARDAEGKGFTDKEIRDEMVTLLFAGSHTSAVGLAWTFHLLATHPEVQERVAEEARAVLGGRAPGAADLHKLPLAGAVVAEQLRVRPPAYGVLRECVAHWTSVTGAAAPARTPMLVSTWAMHHDARWWDAPERFDPDRWLRDADPMRHRFAYIPFSTGPRTCMGSAFATMEATLVVASVAQRVVLRPGPEPPKRHAAVLLEPQGLVLRTEPRRGG